MPFDLAETFLLDAEQALGVALPQAYRSAMLRVNGGEVHLDQESWTLYPIADSSDRKRLSRTANHVVKETLECRRWPRFPSDAVAIASDGTGDQLVFVQRGGELESAVFQWAHESGTLHKVADDFAEFSAASQETPGK